ncbi:hypothetical protein C7974DRAFT_476594 [Boeremia exigua]|uniref:uncharacterized protein n=1 Tax=Boeremia exigua TaxID=749465 RepID=UPI001E8DD77B|nr:uncharacterized protein C7974DRAFT_476594 [Boeremia exigua]KAH6611823.1 hypothetical protein C7974DRAFT_476594 [Boeremia exigua]
MERHRAYRDGDATQHARVKLRESIIREIFAAYLSQPGESLGVEGREVNRRWSGLCEFELHTCSGQRLPAARAVPSQQTTHRRHRHCHPHRHGWLRPVVTCVVVFRGAGLSVAAKALPPAKDAGRGGLERRQACSSVEMKSTPSYDRPFAQRSGQGLCFEHCPCVVKAEDKRRRVESIAQLAQARRAASCRPCRAARGDGGGKASAEALQQTTLSTANIALTTCECSNRDARDCRQGQIISSSRHDVQPMPSDGVEMSARQGSSKAGHFTSGVNTNTTPPPSSVSFAGASRAPIYDKAGAIIKSLIAVHRDTLTCSSRTRVHEARNAKTRAARATVRASARQRRFVPGS